MKKVLIGLVLSIMMQDLVFADGAHRIGRPISELEEIGVIKFSLESNMFSNTAYLSPSISYGWDGWQVGLSSQSIQVSGPSDTGTFQNDTYLNISKTFEINSTYKATLGMQNGFAIPGPLNFDTLHQFLFQDNSFILQKDLVSLHGGAYYVNSALSSSGNIVGFLAGAQIIIVPHKLRLNLDYFSGHNNVSGAVAQLEYKMFSNVNTYVGVGIPEENSGNEFYGIVGFRISEHFFKN